ncbi:MAG: type 2 isopentenyl-diphosphate Delta-isomerase [Alkalispirochaetaceae bacterium]
MNHPEDQAQPEDLSTRKTRHLEICIDAERFEVETGRSRFDEVHLLHRSLPEIDEARIDTSTTFLGKSVRMPLFVSSMTGGSAAGYQANKQLAEAAEQLGIPVGMGSIRILFRKPEVLEHFQLKRFAPSVPVFANIGGVQLPSMDHGEIYRMLDALEVDGIAIHLNPGQELFQVDGDRDFSGILEGIRRFCASAPVPVIVKETGFGISPGEVETLFEAGASYVDLAGSGGTNWAQVESYRLSPEERLAAQEFGDWGAPTALLLAALGRNRTGVLASGGVRTGMDLLRSLALGAELAGTALPFIRAVHSRGVEGAVAYGRRVEKVLRTGMLLTGTARVEELRTAPLRLSEALKADARALSRAARGEGAE